MANNYSLLERLSMRTGQKMEPNKVYHIKKLNDLHQRTDENGEIRYSIIADCEEGFFYLPNVITSSIVSEGIEVGRDMLEGKTVLATTFKAKKYNTNGMTLTIIDE